MYDSVKVFALSAVIVTYCSVQSYPVYTENYDLNENNNSKIIQQTPGEEGDFFEGDIILMPWQKHKFYPDVSTILKF